MNKRLLGLFFSILTACATGAGIAFLGIAVLAEKKEILEQDTSLLEEADQDPSFVSRFSRTFIYSAEDGKEIIENAKNSLPGLGNTEVTAESYAVVDMDRKVVV